MLSLIYTIVKHVIGHKSSVKRNDVDEINNIVAHIEDAYRKDVKKGLHVVRNGECYKTGRITFVSTDYVMVDNFYICDRETITTMNSLELGDKVYYSALNEDSENDSSEYKIQIISLVDEPWNDSYEESGTELSERQSMCRIGKVVICNNRRLIVEPPGIPVNLNSVHSEFIPVIGDWLQIQGNLEGDKSDPDEKFLEIKRIQPLRSKLELGIVSSYDSVKGIGTIDKDIVFNRRVCDSGYVPCVGDKVVHDSIESDQGFYTWRSLTVVPIVQVSKKYTLPTLCTTPVSKENLNELVKNKYGIVITNDNLNVDLNVLEEQNISVTIENTSDVPRVLEKGYFMTKKTQSQLELVQPRNLNTTSVLNPSATLTFIFKCTARFVGTSQELFIFSFKDFEIGRVFHVTVNPKSTEKNKKIHSETSNNKPSIKYVASSNDDWSDSTYIPGVRPCKPPSFIKVRNTLFKIPKYYWDLILECTNENKSHTDTTNDVGGAIPVLLERLTFQSYKDRFHALLYLEEIAQELEIQRYSIESVAMRPRKEFLVMEVPGLAEKRPSLIVGDRAIVSFKWDTTQGSRKYEGYIHKVTSLEIFLKFNQKFHEEYNGDDCQVTFKCSKTGLQRCHNAINVATNRLGSNFLFPTRVIEKDSQLNLQEIDLSNDAAPKSLTHHRTNSISSESSCTSTNTSMSNKSYSTSKSSKRMSVVERLFNVKSTDGNAEPENNSAVTTKDNRQSIGTNVTSNSETSVENDLERVIPVPTENIELESCISQIRKRKLIWFNKNLNYYQKEAVRNILKGHARPLPYVIFGPPGTGKTITLCEAILQILSTIPSSRMLIATPSNSSADLIAERLLESGILNPGDMVRLIAHHYLSNESIPQKLLPYCATADLGDERKQNENVIYNQDGSRLNCNSNTFGRHRITIGTCVALGVLHNIGFPHGHFTHVMIDEAGQATEPEIMIPLNFTHSDHGQVVLAGDPLQLGPVVQSNIAKSFGLDESFLVRLLRHFPYQRDPNGFQTHYDPRLVTKLVINYRSLPEIVELSSSMFYDSELVAQVSPKQSKEAKLLRELSTELPERKGLPPAIVFHGINGNNCRDNDSPSWYNPEEATQAYLYLLKLYKCGVSPADIGIITPYQKQVLEVRDLLMQLDVPLPKISSVEGFQGQERNIIIISAVRSSSNFVNDDIKHSLGFVACPRRLNVAITRARALVIILGNPKLLSQDPYWRNVLTYCIDHDSYTGCNFVLTSENAEQTD